MSEIDDMLQAAGAPPRQSRTDDNDNRHEGDLPFPDLHVPQPDIPAKPTPAGKEKEKTETTETTLQQPIPKADRFITAIYVMLCVISVVELYSASSREVTSANIFAPLLRHVMMIVIGIVICVASSRIKLKYFVIGTPFFVFISMLLMVYVIFNGQIINGARRAVSIVGISIQPAELIKISAVLILAYILSRNQEKGGVTTRGVVMSAIIVIVFSGLLFSQGLTNTLLLMAISLSMMLIGGVQWKKFLVVVLFYGVVGAGAGFYKMTHATYSKEEMEYIARTGRNFKGEKATIERASTWKERVKRYLGSGEPKYNEKITAENRQEMYSYMAQANGGLFGVFPGNSRETARLPLAFSDYIYSIVVEDLGFIGGMFLLALYLSLLGRAGAIASKCDRAFPSLLVMGMAVMIVFQALFHMAIVTGVFPVSGQPLPMISKGGTSIFVTSFAFGIMLSISRYASRVGRRKAKKTLADLPADMAAVNPTQLKK